MPSPRRHSRAFKVRRHAVTFALAWLALLGLLVQNVVASHAHVHRHAVAGLAVSVADVGEHDVDHADGYAHEAVASSDADEHGHRHSGDPETDQQNLGHTHTGGASPGMPPTWSFQSAAPETLLLALPANERPPGDSHPDTPFRPPIA